MDRLNKYCHKCVISFLDSYTKTKRNMSAIDYKEIDEGEMRAIGQQFSKIARKYGMPIETCSEAIDLSEYGINHGKCIDDRIISKLSNSELIINKDKNQRAVCGCVKSIDIGAYNSCDHKCAYCYANFSEKSMGQNITRHNVKSPFLVGEIEEGDIIKEKTYDQ